MLGILAGTIVYSRGTHFPPVVTFCKTALQGYKQTRLCYNVAAGSTDFQLVPGSCLPAPLPPPGLRPEQETPFPFPLFSFGNRNASDWTSELGAF